MPKGTRNSSVTKESQIYNTRGTPKEVANKYSSTDSVGRKKESYTELNKVTDISDPWVNVSKYDKEKNDLRRKIGDNGLKELRAKVRQKAQDEVPNALDAKKIKVTQKAGTDADRSLAKKYSEKVDAAKAKSTVDTAMDEAIEMVKKKKTASRGAY